MVLTDRLGGWNPSFSEIRTRFERCIECSSRASLTSPADYELAAVLYRSCRSRGETVRRLIDCLIAAVAVRAGVEILHADADFEALARHTDVRAHPDSLR